MSACPLVGLMQLHGICIAFKAAAHVQSTSKWKKTEAILGRRCKACTHAGKHMNLESI